MRSLLTKAGRRRNIESDVQRLRTIFRAEYLRQPGVVEDAMGLQLAALLAQFTAARTAAEQLAEAARAHFEQHPDATIITSFPAWGCWPAPGCSPRSETTAPDSPTHGV
ncbi:hypothetical protein ACWEV3_37250 [Saccharopolyspora sp. NPDC003752]